MSTSIPTLKEQVAHVPQSPGCYLWKDSSGVVVYVGKAKNLRSRMRQYVMLQDDREKIPLMMQVVKSFDYLVVENEHEALVLERELINQYHPYFNVDFKDDKSYPYIALTEGDMFPSIKYTRERHNKTTRYFGPYTDSHAARETIEVLRKCIPICSGTCAEWKRAKRMLDSDKSELECRVELARTARPCFDFHVGKGPGVCIGAISHEEYQHHVRQVKQFLSGKRGAIVAELTEQMHDAAANLDFEKAGRIKKRLDAISNLDDRQQVIFSRAVNLDIIGIYREETISAACVFVVREGRTIRSAQFVLDKGLDIDHTELVESFIKRYYDETSDIPAEIVVAHELPDAESISVWLSEKRGRACHIHVAHRGEKHKLLVMAEQNAHHELLRHMVRTGYDDERTNLALTQLESALALDEPPMRIECYDISTLHGTHTVASMVVFTNGKPDKSMYRKFKIRTPLDEANDVLSMREVLARRFSAERLADKRFGSLPDLLIVDGGKPQLNAALAQLDELGVDINVCGLAKSDEEVIVPWSDEPVILPSGSASLYLIKRVRDESHRFAITFHRKLRGKAMSSSILDEIEGVGPKRKKALLRAFGSIKKLAQASVDEIALVPGIPENVAHDIAAVLAAWRKEQTENKEEHGEHHDQR